MHSGHKIETGRYITGKQHEYEQRTSSPPASPTSSSVKGLDSKSPLKIPQGVIVRTPSGRDCQGRKTPPRFFAITNEQLQQMHSTANSESIGPTHFKFQDANQTTDRAKECVCTNYLRRTETNTTKSPKDIKGRPEKIGGMITLTHLLEAEIHRSDMTQTQKMDTQIERVRKSNHFSSPSASPRAECSRQLDPCMQSHKETISPSTRLSGERKVPTSVNHDAESAVKSTSRPIPSTSVLSTAELFPRKVIPNPLQPIDQQSFQCNSDGSILDPSSKSECRIVTPDNRVPKGGLLYMLLSSTESADDHQICRPSLKEHNIVGTTKTISDIQDQKSVMDQANPKLPNSLSSRGIVASKCPTNELKETNDFTTKAGVCGRPSHTSEIVKASNSRPTQMSTSWPEVDTEYSSTLASKGVGASLTSIKSKAHNVSCTLQAMNQPLLTKSQKAGKVLVDSAGIPEVPCTYHAGKSSGNLSEKVKRKGDSVVALDNSQNTLNTSQVMNDGTPSHEQKGKCPRKTTLIINSVKTTSASVGPCSSAGPSGQLYGLLRSPNNATGNVMLVPLGSKPQSRKGSTTLTGSGNNIGAVKPQPSAPVMINNMALTGNINTDAFNVWKSYVRQAYHDKYGTNCEYYMHSRWINMSVAEKSPFVHQVQNSLRPPVLVQTSSSNPSKTSQEVIDIKAPTSKNSKAEIQRQIDIIPRLQTTGPHRPVADNPVSLSEQDIMRELYRSTKMANISPDFPMASNNSTFRKMMKSSSDFLTDPASSFDPVFAHCVLSGRRHDIDNWMAMKTNWQVTPEWIVDFRAACDERKRARRAAIDAGVMRRVAMAQRMARTTDDEDDDDEVGSSSSTGQTPRKQSGKKFQQFGDSKENTPVCQEKSRQSVPIGGLSPKVGTSFDKKGDRCLTPAEVPTATRTLTKGLEVVKPVSQDQLTPECGLSSPYNARHSSSCECKIESQPQVIAAMTSKESHPTVCPNTTLPTSMKREDEVMPYALPIKNAESYSRVSQEEGCHSQDENLIGDLDLIDDEHLWNIQCSLFPPWQRVPSFIDADAADDFFKDLERDSLGVSVAPTTPSIFHNLQMENVAKIERAKNKAFLPDNHDVDFNVLGHVNQTQHNSHCREALSITSAEENIPSTSSAIPHTPKGCKKAMDSPHANRRLFSDIPIKNECQPGDCEPTEPIASLRAAISKTAETTHGVLNIQEWLDDCIESTSGDVSGKGIQTTDPMSREEEEDAAVTKLLEILDETQRTTLPENFETVSYQKITSEHGWTTEEKVVSGGCSRITAYDVQVSTGERPSQMVGEFGKWHEEIKPINAVDVTSFTSPLPLIENPRLKLSPVKENLNEVVRDDDNDYSFSKSDEPSRQKEILIDHVEGVTHGMPVDAGSPEHSVIVSRIFRTKAEAEDNSGKIERWHEDIKPIIALAVNSSSSSSSVENEIRQTHPTNNPRTTPVDELQEGDTKSDDLTEVQKDDGQADTKEQTKTTSSSSGEYVTADETDPHARGFDGRRTPDLCPTIKTEPCEEASQTSMTDESSSPLVSADGPTTFREFAEDDVSDGEKDKAVFSEEKKSHVPARKYHGRIRKKRRQDMVSDDPNENAPEASPAFAQPSSDTSLTSVSSSSTSSSRIATSRKSRGRKRRRRVQRHRNKCDRKAPRDGCSPQESRKSVVAKEKTPLNQDVDRNDSEGDAPNKSSFKRAPRQSPETNTTTLLEDQEDGPSRPQGAGHADHADEDQSDDDSPGDQSPTSLKIVMRRSSRLKVRRVSKLPRLRSKRNAPGTFQRNASRTSVHAKVKKTRKRKIRVK